MSTEELGGPYVRSAMLCQLVMHEDNGMESLIRCLDRTFFTIQPNTEPDLTWHYVLHLAFVPGFFEGNLRLQVDLLYPSGGSHSMFTQTMLFESKDKPVRVAINMSVKVKEQGLHWYTVKLGDAEVTRVPWRVIFQYPPNQAKTQTNPPG